MKWILMGLLCPSAFALTLAKHQSGPAGSLHQEFQLESSAITYLKETNFFDSAKGPLQSGTMVLKTLPKDFPKWRQALEGEKKKIVVADEFLRSKNSSYNQLVRIKGHPVLLLLDGFTVVPSAKEYGPLNKIFESLQKLDWKLRDGFVLSPNLETVTTVKDGKPLKTEKFDRSLYCSPPPVACTFFGGGKVFIK